MMSRWAVLPMYLSSLLCTVLSAPSSGRLGGHDEDYFVSRRPDRDEAMQKIFEQNDHGKAFDYPPPISSPRIWDLRTPNASYHEQYHPLWEVDGFMAELTRDYPDYVRLVNLGHSAQGREMLALQISKPGGGDPIPPGKKIVEDDDVEAERKKKENERREGSEKLGFVIIGAQHAREWIASATAMYIAHALVSDSVESKPMHDLLDQFEFHIIPVPNPDGYVYTWESDRFWYKNRMIVGPNEQCVGLDMNRNWGYAWVPDSDLTLNVSGSLRDDIKSGDPCSHWYPGHRPFEAPEVNNIANYITQTPRLKAFMDLRSYGQMLSTPFSYSCDALPAEAEDQIEAALGAVQAVRKKHGTVYTTGKLCEMLYPAPGNILDWMYGEAGIKFSFAAHLRDTGTYGYVLPPEWIRPVGEETATMIAYLAKFMTSLPKIH